MASGGSGGPRLQVPGTEPEGSSLARGLGYLYDAGVQPTDTDETQSMTYRLRNNAVQPNIP
jgi:hypothetical protein